MLSRGGIAHHGAIAIIDLSFLARSGENDGAWLRHCGLLFADETLDALIAGGEAVAIHQILPDGFGIAAAG